MVDPGRFWGGALPCGEPDFGVQSLGTRRRGGQAWAWGDGGYVFFFWQVGVEPLGKPISNGCCRIYHFSIFFRSFPDGYKFVMMVDVWWCLAMDLVVGFWGSKKINPFAQKDNPMARGFPDIFEDTGEYVSLQYIYPHDINDIPSDFFLESPSTPTQPQLNPMKSN